MHGALVPCNFLGDAKEIGEELGKKFIHVKFVSLLSLLLHSFLHNTNPIVPVVAGVNIFALFDILQFSPVSRSLDVNLLLKAACVSSESRTFLSLLDAALLIIRRVGEWAVSVSREIMLGFIGFGPALAMLGHYGFPSSKQTVNNDAKST